MKGGKLYSTLKQLQNLLYKQTITLSDEAIQSEGRIPSTKIETLERLERLIEIQKAAEPPRRIRWPVITLLAVTLIIVSLLLFAHVSSTEIELDLSLSEVSFRLPEQQVLTDEIRLSSLGVSGIQEIQLPRSETREAQVLQITDGLESAIRLALKLKDKEESSVTLAPLILPAKTHIDLSPTEISQQYRLSIKGTELSLNAGVHGLIEIGRTGTPLEHVNFLSPKSILLHSRSKEIDIDMNLLTGTKSIFSRQLLADSLSLFSIDEHTDADRTIVRRISSIASGTIFFESLGGKEQRLRAGQEVRFESSSGEIRTIELKDNHIAFAFHGIVGGMTTGNDNNRISLMPTYLEWLSARHGLSLLWGTTLYIFGIIFSVLRWWRAKS